MICPYRKRTETTENTTKEYYMECYGINCPYYVDEQHYKYGLKTPPYCKRPRYEVENK
jgi:hypothetical protein